MKRLVLLLAVFFVWKFLINGLNYLYVDGETQAWNRILWHNFYAQEENIDYLYLGSSHVYFGLNPFLLDELNGRNNFNLSTGSQKLNGSYYLLKEVDKAHELKHVYVELFFWQSTGMNGAFLTNEGGRVTNWRNTDYMKPSFNRLKYMVDISEPDDYIETLFPFIRYREKFFDWKYVKEQIEYKRTEPYKNYQYSREDEQKGREIYCDKGYWYSEQELRTGALSAACRRQGELKEHPMTEEAELYLRKLLAYCQKENIPVTLFSSPMPDLYILAAEYEEEKWGNYDNYVNQVRSIAAEYGTEYYDFNLCKEEYLSLKTENFRDIHHLNSSGAELFTSLFHQVMQGTKEENSGYFYDSYAQKLAQTDARIYGLLRTGATEDSRSIFYRVASNREEGMEYRILLTPSEGETVGVQDFSENTEFEVPAEEHGICTIVARELGETDKVQTLEIEY